MNLNQKIQLIQPQVFEKLIKYGARHDPSKKLKGYQTKPLLLYYSYRFVKETLPSYLTDGNIEELLKVYFDIKKPSKLKVQKVVPLFLWLYDELKKVKELEENYLSTPPDGDMLMAGVDTLNELGEYATVDMLVKDWGIYTHNEIYDMAYHEVFNKLRLMKLQGDIQRKLAKIQRDKAKKK